jgi:hypothetical protein
MLGLGIIIGAALVGAAWAVWGWRDNRPDRHELYMRERKRALRAWYHRKPRCTMPLFVRTKTVAPLPLDWGR